MMRLLPVHIRYFLLLTENACGWRGGPARDLPLLLVGISYDKNTKEHQCRIERLNIYSVSAKKEQILLFCSQLFRNFVPKYGNKQYCKK